MQQQQLSWAWPALPPPPPPRPPLIPLAPWQPLQACLMPFQLCTRGQVLQATCSWSLLDVGLLRNTAICFCPWSPSCGAGLGLKDPSESGISQSIVT